MARKHSDSMSQTVKDARAACADEAAAVAFWEA